MANQVSADYRPSENEPFMNERQREYFRRKLNVWKDEILKESRETIQNLLTLAGFSRGDERASAVLALETAMAQSQATREASANDHNADNVWTPSDFARRAPGMDWTVFFDAAGLAKERELVVWQPTAVTGLAAQVASQPLEAWKDYLRFPNRNRSTPASAAAAPRMR